jgi:hypothetical protein
MLEAVIFGGIAVPISSIVVFLVMKLLRLKSGVENKAFFWIFAGVMMLCYLARARLSSYIM